MKTPRVAIALLVACAPTGCAKLRHPWGVTNVYETRRERIERNLVFKPRRLDPFTPGPAAPADVELVTFSVHDPAAHPAKRWAVTPAARKLLESGLVSALESGARTTFRHTLDATLAVDEAEYRTGVDGPRDAALREAERRRADAEKTSRERREAEADARRAAEYEADLARLQQEPFYWKLHGAYVEAPTPGERRASVLFCHGSKGSIDDHVHRVRKIAARLNVSILAFDYRGFGRSEGVPDEAGVLADARAARHYLAVRTGVPETSVVLLGVGFGTAIAVDLAANDGCRGLVLENAFTSLADAADAQAPRWLEPSRWMRTRLSSLDKIARYPGPLLQCHGDSNDVVPLANGRALFDAAPGPKKFFVVPNGEHDEPPPREFYDELAALPPEPRDPRATPGVKAESVFGPHRPAAIEAARETSSRETSVR